MTDRISIAKMSSERYGFPEYSTTHNSRNHFDAIRDIVKAETITEEPIEIKWSSENGVCDESSQEVEDGRFPETISTNCEKNPRDSKPSPTQVFVNEDIKPEIHGDKLSGKNSHPNAIGNIVPHESSIDFWKNTNFDTKDSEYTFAADQEVDQIKKEIKVENPNEDYIGCTEDLFTINADLKTQTLKTEDGIEDIKPEIHGDKLSGKNSHPNAIGNIVPHESSIDFWKNTNFDTKDSAYIFAADQEVDQIKKEIVVENPNEDYIGCTDNLFTINDDLKTQTLKPEDGIDIVYEDIKPEIHGDKLRGKKSHPNAIGNIVPHKSSIDFGAGPQQNTTVEEDETDVERYNEKRFQCNFSKIGTLKIYERSHAVAKPFQCNFCLKSFTESCVLKIHERIHTGEKPFQCNICLRSFTQSSSLKSHEMTHTGEKPFHCNLCLKSFTSNSAMKYHERIHTGEKPFQCDICLKSYRHSGALRTHERTHAIEKPFQCNFCSKAFTRSTALKYHKRTHTGEKPFQCNLCPKSFMQSGTLKIHERTHTGAKPFQCNVCSKSFSLNSNLRSHERTHTGEKPFQCNFCSNSFSQNSTLKAHERTHTGEKPFQCNICPKSFTQNSTLKIHERTHTGEKSFQCNFCSKSFTQNGSLKKHERTHTGEETFQCKFV